MAHSNAISSSTCFRRFWRLSAVRASAKWKSVIVRLLSPWSTRPRRSARCSSVSLKPESVETISFNISVAILKQKHRNMCPQRRVCQVTRHSETPTDSDHRQEVGPQFRRRYRAAISARDSLRHFTDCCSVLLIRSSAAATDGGDMKCLLKWRTLSQNGPDAPPSANLWSSKKECQDVCSAIRSR
jgi:hypothetical protein